MLHFGYWDKDDPKTWESIPQAQIKYTDNVFACIPQGTKTILDVGCGTGNASYRLSNMGYSVDCVSPDLLQKEMIEKKYGNKLAFHCSRFEDLEINKKFDLILMMESCQYLNLDQSLPKCKQLLNKNGKIIISDLFQISAERDYRSFHRHDEFLDRLEKMGFKINSEKDITLNTAVICEVVSSVYYQYVLPVSKTIIESIEHSVKRRKIHGLFLKILKKLFKKDMEKAEDNIFKRIPRLLDKDNFLRQVKYIIYVISC